MYVWNFFSQISKSLLDLILFDHWHQYSGHLVKLVDGLYPKPCQLSSIKIVDYLPKPTAIWHRQGVPSLVLRTSQKTFLEPKSKVLRLDSMKGPVEYALICMYGLSSHVWV